MRAWVHFFHHFHHKRRWFKVNLQYVRSLFLNWFSREEMLKEGTKNNKRQEHCICHEITCFQKLRRHWRSIGWQSIKKYVNFPSSRTYMCSHFLQHSESLTIRLICSRLSSSEKRDSNDQVANTDYQRVNRAQETVALTMVPILWGTTYKHTRDKLFVRRFFINSISQMSFFNAALKNCPSHSVFLWNFAFVVV